jgi:hypothetical protein
VGRALDQLGIEYIAAYSPEARGRSERMFGTLQERLPKELKLAGITEIDVANRFLREVYLPAHNARFARSPQIAEIAFVTLADPAPLADILCIEEERVVARDNTIAHEGRRLQLPQSPVRAPLRQSPRQGARVPGWDVGGVARAGGATQARSRPSARRPCCL